MRVELDHVFICTDAGAPAAEKLIQFGVREGLPNRHPGQGTANRRFSFLNAMIELLWVDDACEAQSELTRPTLLWERWSGRNRGACPFGICVRSSEPHSKEVPFPAWEYRPAYLPEPLAMHIADTGIEEPMWVYLNFLSRADREKHFTENPRGAREITGLTITSRVQFRSSASQALIESGILSNRQGEGPLLEIQFDGCYRNQIIDLRPDLPMVFEV